MELTYWMPVKVIAGKDVVLNNKEIFVKYGKKAYIITGKRSSKLNGSLQDVLEALKSQDIEYIIFDEIEENPAVETIVRAANKGKEAGVDYIVAIGGGSPLDAAKAIGAMIYHPHITGDTLFTKERLKSIPLLAVPTTSGTGSETTPYAILTVHGEQTKKNLGQTIFFDVAFLDAKYTMELPYSITIHTAIDALTHLIEGYLNKNSTQLSDMLAEKGMKIWGECIPALLNNQLNYETREKLMLASSIAGMTIAHTGTSLPHGMGYPLTYFKGVPHGLANGILYREYLRVFKDTSKLDKIHELLGLKTYEELEDMLEILLQTDICVTEEEMKEWSLSMSQNKLKLKNHPEQVGYEEIYQIYYESLKDNLS